VSFRLASLFGALLLSAVLHAEEAAALLDGATAYKKGINFLVATQNKNGSWGTFETRRVDEVFLGTTASFTAFGNATTALCVLALLEPAADNKDASAAVEKGIKFLIKAPPVLRATGDALYNIWTHTYVLQAMSAVIKEPRLKKFHSDAKKVAKQQVEALGRLQGADGGFGYYDFSFASAHPTGSESTSFNNAAALLAIEDAKNAGVEVPEALVDSAVKSLARLKLSDGAYVYGVYAQYGPRRLYNRINGSLGRSQVCNLAMLHFKQGVTSDDLVKGLDSFFDQHHFIEMGKGRPIPHESWYQTAGYYFFFGHYYGSRVIQEVPAEKRKKYADAMRDIMVRLQDPDGAWWDFPLYGYYKAYGTAFALMTLANCSK
jgi:hypothetical protein